MRPALRALLGLATLAFIGLALVVRPAQTPDALFEPARPAPAFGPLPDSWQGQPAERALTQRSPFAPDRGPYSRIDTAPAPAAASVRLVAVYGASANRRATLDIDGVEIDAGVGDATAIGRIAAIRRSAVEFEDGRTIELFEN